eukprot:scaffold47433_cov23-Tisochrysis_lutea.AAC.1
MPAVCTPSCCFLGEPSCVVATLEVAPNSQGLPEGVLECATKPLSPGLLPSDIFILALNKEFWAVRSTPAFVTLWALANIGTRLQTMQKQPSSVCKPAVAMAHIWFEHAYSLSTLSPFVL